MTEPATASGRGREPTDGSLRRALLILLLGVCIWGGWCLRGNPRGLAWDEPGYILAGTIYLGLRAPPPGLSVWESNPEHPPLAKLLFGLGGYAWALVFGDPDSFVLGARAVVIGLFGALLAGLWLWARPFGRATAWAAVILAFLTPRLLGHAQLATLDLPLAAFWIWTCLAYERATRREGPRAAWSAAAVLLFGCALLTRFTAVLLPVALLAWRLGLLAGERLLPKPRPGGAESGPSGPRPGARLGRDFCLLGAMIAGGLVLLVAGWPWLWEDTGARLLSWLRWSTRGAMNPVLYLGTVFGADWTPTPPPWHYAPVMLLLTTPVVVTVGVVLTVGLARAGLLRSRPLLLALAGGGVVPLLTCLPTAPAYDGVRLFLMSLPCGSVLAAWGWSRALGRVRARWGRMCSALPVRMAGALLLAGYLLFLFRPDPLAFYSLAAGGVRGAGALGMERIYWGTPLGRAERDLLRAATEERPSPRVALVGFGPVFDFGQRVGWLPGSWREADPGGAWDYAVVLERRSLPEVGAFHERYGSANTADAVLIREVVAAQPVVGRVRVAGLWRRASDAPSHPDRIRPVRP